MQLLEMVERNELNRSLLTLLDENIANAHEGNQVLLETPVHVVQIEFNMALMCFYFFGGGGGRCCWGWRVGIREIPISFTIVHLTMLYL